jgi:predicted peptidase
MRKILLILIMLPALCFGQQFTEHPLPAKKPYPYPMAYLEHVPPAGACIKPPILIFAHGIGEGYNNGPLSILIKTGLPALIQAGKMPVDSFLVLCPQGPKYISVPALKSFVEYAKKTYAATADTSKIYFTGLSGGAITMANYGREYAGIKAMVLAAGFPKYTLLCATKATKTSMWLFHNKGDALKWTGDNQYIINYNSCLPAGGEKAIGTFYEGGSHNVWDRMYANPDIYRWLLKHK